ncbi:MAG: DUF1926 domain-containing protein, partial [Spirochaetaceae bacterium]
SYKPFFSTLYEFDTLPAVLYFSGTALELLEKHHPECINIIDEMIKRKQVEILGGGYYDPAFPLIPVADKLGQIEMFTTYVRSRFGKRPRGFWSPEQMWDSQMPNIVRSCGLEYSFLNDYSLFSAGVSEDQLYFPYLVEEQGKNITVFPLDSSIMSRGFRQTPNTALRSIKNRAARDKDTVTAVFFDGGTFKKQYTSQITKTKRFWLKDLCGMLSRNRNAIIPVIPSEYLKKNKIVRKVYVSGDYSSSLKNALNDRNGINKLDGRNVSFKQILTKYDEANLLYGKMMYTNVSLQQLKGDKYRKNNAREELWKSQSHFGYWHGGHCGIYSTALREEMYRNLISAEKLSRIKGVFFSSIISTDFDFDGENELLYQSNDMNVYVHTRGATVFELDYIPVLYNYANTVTRKREHYHTALCKSIDSYQKRIFCDHFIPADLVFSQWKHPFSPLKGDMVHSLYSVTDLKREQRQILFEYKTSIFIHNQHFPVTITKKYSFKKNMLQVSYSIKNNSELTMETTFASEINLSLPSFERDSVSITDATKKSAPGIDAISEERSGVKEMVYEDKRHGTIVRISSEQAYTLWHQAQFAQVMNEGKIEDVYQHMCDLLSWKLSIAPEGVWEGMIELSIERA